MAFNILRRRLRIARLENAMSPRQIHEMIATRPRLGQLFQSSERLQNMRPADFERDVISSELLFFRRPPAPGKSLLICFTDVNFGLFSPTPMFLQSLGDLAVDVVVVSDHRQAYFENGLRNQTTSLLGTCEFIRGLIADSPYAQVLTYGCSIGGLAALRAGLFLNARRAICVGGRFASRHIWNAIGKVPATAFDPLCGSFSGSVSTQIVAVYSSGNFHDVECAQEVNARIPNAFQLPCPLDQHNIFIPIRGTIGERELLLDLFNPDYDLTNFDYKKYRRKTALLDWQ